MNNTNDVIIYIIGDSTACDYPEKDFPMTGWGQALPIYCSLKIDNRAIAGRSTKSFLEEGHWEKIMKLLKKNDYVIIQFGHNDEKKDDPKRFTTPGDTYNKYLSVYIKDVISKEAIPILFTPIHRRNFVQGKLVNTHENYLEEVEKVAKELNVIFFDIAKETEKLINIFGEEDSKKLFMIYDKNEMPNYKNGVTDNTHLNNKGANEIAKIVAKSLLKVNIF